jgi:glycosyltransferase involved in cell wall biosynthesis
MEIGTEKATKSSSATFHDSENFGDAVIAILVPCYNEERTIAQVVKDFRAALPGAIVYVYDNNSQDATGLEAASAGAIVRNEPLQGKGHVVRRMFADIEADAYVMIDGDGTYDVASARAMVELLLNDNLDMVVGCRVDNDIAAYRKGHRFGNALLTGAVSRLFGNRCKDILSGYRVFSRRFVKSFPVFSRGFDIECELTVHALTLELPMQELPTNYGARPAGSTSKLRTYRDGIRILRRIFDLVREERPLFFFTWTAFVLALISLILAYPVVTEFLRTGLVLRFPTAILATGFGILSALSLTCGSILDTVTRGRRSALLLAYLSIPRWNGSKDSPAQ